MNAGEKLNALMERLVPVQLFAGDREQHERAKLIAVLAMISVPIYGIFLSEALVQYQLPWSALVIGLGGVLSLLGPLVLRRTGSVLFLGNYLSLTLFVVLGFYSWQRGGFVPSVLMWNLCIVAFGLLQSHQRFLVGWTALILLEITALWLLRGVGLPATAVRLGEGYAGLLASLLAIGLASVYVERARRRAEAARMRLLERLLQEQRLESLGRMAGGVAHDFNNLLSAVKLHASLALEELEADSELGEDLQTILDAARRGSALTAQLLAFGRHDAVHPEVLDAAAVIADMTKLLAGMLKRGAELEIEAAGDLPEVRLDRGQLEQVVMNLVLNAADASPEGGSVTIRLSRETLVEPEASHGLHADAGDYLLIEVRDEGSGIDAESMPLLFEPFFTSKPRGKGTGLGLATVFGVLKRAGGLVRVRSQPDRGTSFEALFPAAPPGDRRARVLSERHELPHNATVLIAEDEPSCRAAVERILAAQGHMTLTAEDGDSALAVSDRHHGDIDVLLTDIQMPGLDGVALADAIRAKRPSIRVVYMSGAYDRDEVRAQVDERRASFLQKPIDADKLLRKVG